MIYTNKMVMSTFFQGKDKESRLTDELCEIIEGMLFMAVLGNGIRQCQL
jgi:hypothetical protein